MVGTSSLIERSTSRELICVCCNCRRQRTGDGEWQEHTPRADDRVSHGICPACLYELYPDIAPLVRPRNK